ncbi:MAG: sulfatase-like hydrolase/transferase [Gemmataceae bacterium]
MFRILIGLTVFIGCVKCSQSWASQTPKPTHPNIVLVVADDLGWGDVAYNGHPHVKTPSLDDMASKGLRFNRFYAAHPVCSPTRGSIMTGRHPARYGCFNPNYSIRPQEFTLAQLLKMAGYHTGHFGKWHLGPVKANTPINPGACGFDTWVSHDNWFDLNPSLSRNGNEPQKIEGESSDVVMDEALKWISNKAKGENPFFAFVCFASPHLPHKATDKDRKPYRKLSTKMQNYLGEITALDRAVGKLRSELRKLGIAENTIVIFCGDNGAKGPEGSTGGLRGFKGSIWEGGVRVPGLMEWPARIKKGRTTGVPCVTSDFFPTVVDLLQVRRKHPGRVLDGISLKPLIEGKMQKRPEPIHFWRWRGSQKGAFYLPLALRKGWWRTFNNRKYSNPRTMNFSGHAAIVDNNYKLHQLKPGKFELYDLVADSKESNDIAKKHPDLVRRLARQLNEWQASVERSLAEEDYKERP